MMKVTQKANTHIKAKELHVRKTRPWSNKTNAEKNTEDTQYNRDTDLRGSPSVGYIHQRNCQVLLFIII
jgi:hypothetical protein